MKCVSTALESCNIFFYFLFCLGCICLTQSTPVGFYFIFFFQMLSRMLTLLQWLLDGKFGSGSALNDKWQGFCSHPSNIFKCRGEDPVD